MNFRILLAGLLSGCMFFTTKGEGRTLQKDVAELRGQVGAQQKAMEEATRKAELEVAELQKVLDQATKVVTRNSADVGAEVEKLRARLDAIEGQMAETAAALEALRKEFGEYKAQAATKQEAEAPAEAALPKDKDALYALGQKLAADGKRDDARKALRAFLDRFPEDARAADARLLLGDTYLDEQKLQQAAGEYQKVIDNYPRSGAADDAFLKNGEIMFKLKFCVDARVYLQELQRRFPKSPLVRDAQKLIGEIDKARGNRAKCAN